MSSNLFALLIIFFSTYVSAQVPLYTNYEHFTTEQGLPQSFVTTIVQDNDGFIWVSTLDGLARYDGKQFVHFNIDSPDGRSISSSQTYDLRLEGDVLWVLHYNYVVDQINTKTLKVKRDIEAFISIDKKDFLIDIFVPTLERFANDPQDNWFVGDTTQYHLYDSTNVKMEALFEKKIKPFPFNIYGYLEDSSRRLWLMKNNALLVSDTSWANFKQINIPDWLNFEPKAGQPKPMIELSGQRILFAFANRAFIYDQPNNDFRELVLPKRKKAISNALSLTTDPQGNAIIINSGLILRLEEDERITTLWENPVSETFVINDVLIDQSNTMWVAIHTGGLYRVDLNTPTFQSRRYKRNFLADLLTQDMGVDLKELPKNWQQPTGWAYGMRYSYSDLGLFLTHESYGFGNQRRLYRLNQNKFEQLPLEDKFFYYLIGVAESSDELWALDIEGNMFNWDDLKALPKENQFKAITKRVTTERLSDMVADDEYQWVIATKNILYQVKKGKIVDQFSVGKEGSSLIDLSLDISDPDLLWIGTLGGGLIKWSKKTKTTVTIYDTSDGLSNNSIGAVVPDSLGNIWLATFNGISRLDIDQEKFTNYYTKDGIIESEFNRHHGFILPDGRIALGGTLGYSIFDPKHFVADEYQPSVNISELQLNNRVIDVGSGQFEKGLNELTTLELDYNQNSIRLEVAAMQFNDPAANQYRYKLDNYHSDWVENGNQRVVRIDNLPSGSYQLNLNASNTDGVWSEKIRSIKIQINPPLWLSWWAYGSYTISLMLVLYLLWKSYNRRLMRNQEIAFNKREAARLLEMNEMKTRFFSNITHEFRTPLTLILSPLEKYIKRKDFPPKAIEILKSNYRHGSHLLRLVNQLLDIAKLESGNMQLHHAAGELGGFAENCVGQFELLAQKRKIKLTFTNDQVAGYYLFDQGHWEKIIYNLLSNAIKFTPEGGEVFVRLYEEQNLITHHPMGVIEVQDTGIGIKKELIPNLFERFYQVDGSASRDHGGTGIGLSLVKELTTLMSGEVFVESEIGKGTLVTVKIPISRFIETSPIERREPEETSPVISANSNGESTLVLVVEDNDELRSFIVESLVENWNVLSATNGIEARELIEKELPDIVISDVMMPGMNGIELCHITKADHRTAHINFIMLTAKTAQESKEEGLQAGADDYLTKPFHFSELELRIQNLVQHQKNLRKHLKAELLPSSPTTQLPSVDDEFLNKLYAYLKDEIKNPTLSVDILAETMAMSRSTLNRKLKALLNISTNEFIKQYRLQQAVELIHSGLSIKEVAFQVGFDSPSYFSQCFKESFAQSPSDYQKTVKH